jgi:hypothetical protein
VSSLAGVPARLPAGLRVRLVRGLLAGLLAGLAGCGAGAAPDRAGSAAAPSPLAEATFPLSTSPPSTSPPATSPPAASTGAAERTATSASAGRSFTFVATGDVLLHNLLWFQARRDAAAAGKSGYDFRPILAGLRPLVSSADLALCHLETPLAPASGPFRNYPSFSVPPQIAPALAATGYDACTTASNHTLDQGFPGVVRTLEALHRAGIAHTGSARSAAEARRPLLLPVGGARVAVLSYTYGFNGYPLPPARPWAANRIDERRILADARQARRAGADVVVVALHWGQEYVHQPTPQQARLAPRLLRSPDVDLLIGHHAHVVQPVERIGEEWVAYGLGNSVAAHNVQRRANMEGLLVRFTFSERADGGWRVTKAEYAPMYQPDSPPHRIVDLGRALSGSALNPGKRREYRVSFERVRRVVEGRGGAEDGLRPIRR